MQTDIPMTCIFRCCCKSQCISGEKEETLALPLDAGLEDDVSQDEDSMFAKLIAGDSAGVSRATPRSEDQMEKKIRKQHVERKVPPSMIIEIEKEGDGEDDDVVIDMETPYSDVQVEFVSKLVS